MSVVSDALHDQETTAWETAVSAWVDGEESIRAEELDTPYGRQLWDTYHMIGDVLRSDDLAIEPSDVFYARVSSAIDAEPAIVAPTRAVTGRWRRGASGLAVAAAVAGVAWFMVPMFGDDPATQDVAPSGQQVVAATSTETDEDLHDYVDAHQDLTGSIPVRLASYAGARH